MTTNSSDTLGSSSGGPVGGPQNNQLLQAAISNLFRGLQNQQLPQTTPPFSNNNNNTNLLQQIQWLQQQQQQQQNSIQQGNTNQLAQALLTALTANDAKPADSSSDGVSAHYSASSKTRSGSSSSGRRTVVVPCRARGMSMEHNFRVTLLRNVWAMIFLRGTEQHCTHFSLLYISDGLLSNHGRYQARRRFDLQLLRSRGQVSLLCLLQRPSRQAELSKPAHTCRWQDSPHASEHVAWTIQ